VRVIRVYELMALAGHRGRLRGGRRDAAVNGRPTTELTLSAIVEMLSPRHLQLTIERGAEVIKKSLTPRKMI
jgi:hypothetical protein